MTASGSAPTATRDASAPPAAASHRPATAAAPAPTAVPATPSRKRRRAAPSAPTGPVAVHRRLPCPTFVMCVRTGGGGVRLAHREPVQPDEGGEPGDEGGERGDQIDHRERRGGRGRRQPDEAEDDDDGHAGQHGPPAREPRRRGGEDEDDGDADEQGELVVDAEGGDCEGFEPLGREPDELAADRQDRGGRRREQPGHEVAHRQCSSDAEQSAERGGTGLGTCHGGEVGVVRRRRHAWRT